MTQEAWQGMNDDEKNTEGAEATQEVEATNGNRLEELPEWAQKEIKQLRNENASRRTQLQETRSQLSQAKTPEDFASLTTDFNTKLAEKDREIAGLTHGLPKDIAARIQGASFEDMLKDAEMLAGLFKPQAAPAATERKPEPPARLTGGLTPSDAKEADASEDPAALAAAALKAINRY